jgi:nitrogen regulatory protein PII
VIEALMNHDVHGLTVTEVRGFGRQLGQPAPGTDLDLGLPRSVALLPKVRLDLTVPDDHAGTVAEVVAKHARTGMIGDGKIWVSEVGSVLRVRNGDQDHPGVVLVVGHIGGRDQPGTRRDMPGRHRLHRRPGQPGLVDRPA